MVFAVAVVLTSREILRLANIRIGLCVDVFYNRVELEEAIFDSFLDVFCRVVEDMLIIEIIFGLDDASVQSFIIPKHLFLFYERLFALYNMLM